MQFKSKKLLISMLLALASAGSLLAQEKTLTVDGSVELYSAYIWRGDKVCGTQFSPTVNFRYGSWTLQSFGFLAIDGSYKEIDWDLSYKYKDFSFHFADYYYHGSGYPQPEDYFDFKKNSSTHVLEGIICYDPENLPLSARWFTFVFGSYLPDSGKNAFSSYLELEAFHNFGNGGKLSLFLGSSVLKGPYTNYEEAFMPIHLELRYRRSVEIAGAHLPITASYTINPYTRSSFLNAGIGVEF
ncbi:MAG: hypothetical protein K6F21_06835 [Bacteroidales bacterium]|nr:hypothetical protein [Bacteroidales bacterium]